MNNNRTALAVAFIAGAAIGYFLGYDFNFERTTTQGISDFRQCMAAGYPVMESHPRQCSTPDGRNFVEILDGPVACTADAKQCPDGSSVGRIPPGCRFAACP